MIEILKASAGSGKTFNLAKKYIELLLTEYKEDKLAYRHILAVTFTNKATEEMKSRILEELNTLATDPAKSGYINDFVPAIMPDLSSVKSASETILCNILHDYGAFSVSTIDKFFQQTLKAFSREIGQFESYQVELDKDSLIRESVDRVLDSLTESDRDKLRWLTDHALSEIEDGKGYKLETVLYKIGQRLKCEQHRSKAEECGIDEGSLLSQKSLESLKSGCDKVIKDFGNIVVEAAKEIDSQAAACGINPEVTYTAFLNKLIETYSVPQKEVKKPSNSVMGKLNGPIEAWFKKADVSLAAKVGPGLVAAVEKFANLFNAENEDAEYKVYMTARLLKEKIYGLGLANDISREFSALLKEKNVLSIDDSNTILKGIIDGTEAPFIYEKLGVRYKHFLLDEFQDTSQVQWDNFKPLLANSVSQDFFNLVVGDVKQSIYRWRGSDSDLLGSKIDGEFGGAVLTRPLGDNWRSLKEIVEFNNDFFSFASKAIQNKFDPSTRQILDIYSDVKQNVVKKNAIGGSVSIGFCDSEMELETVYNTVLMAKEAGYEEKDIAVLVRGNANGSQVAGYLIERGISVVTDDSLKIVSSLTVRRLMALLSSIDNPSDTMAQYLSRELNVELPSDYHSLVDLCEELLRALRKSDEETFAADTLYIQSFMDKVQDFVNGNSDGLHAFLEKMKDDQSSISSPSVGNSVRIMTIHKSKGLDFPVVIIPFIEQIGLFRPGDVWCQPNVAGTALDGVASGIYDVTLSAKSEDTLFGDEYRNELLKQYVDNINIAYVAFTRPSKAMFLIAASPEKPDGLAGENGAPNAKNFGELLWSYVLGRGGSPQEGWQIGDFRHHNLKKDAESVNSLAASYPSWPLGDRLSFSCDSGDFFSEDGESGEMASARRRGIVLHDILASVEIPSDLTPAVSNAVSAGFLPADQEQATKDWLEARILSASSRGWFPEKRSHVRNEAALITADGEFKRPDRVVRTGDSSVVIIDYKFGAPKETQKKRYVSQVLEYASLYKELGYKDVKAFLWYVESDDVVEPEMIMS